MMLEWTWECKYLRSCLLFSVQVLALNNTLTLKHIRFLRSHNFLRCQKHLEAANTLKIDLQSYFISMSQTEHYWSYLLLFVFLKQKNFTGHIFIFPTKERKERICYLEVKPLYLNSFFYRKNLKMSFTINAISYLR